MNNKHDQFDEAALNELKNHHCGYHYCPKCGRPLVKQDIDHRLRMICSDDSCGFIFYQNPIPAAGVMVVQDGRILLVKRAHPPRIGWWCIPAGFMEWEEHPRETAVRELAEETGLEIRLTSTFDIYHGNDDPRTNAVLILYLGEVVGGELQAADDALDVRYFPLNDLPEKIAFEAHIQALKDYIDRFES